MSRANNLFSRRDVYSVSKYSKFIGKEVYIRQYKNRGGTGAVYRGVVTDADLSMLSIRIRSVDSSEEIGPSGPIIKITYATIEKISKAGENIYEDLIRRE